jgi:hypothetical protein
MADAKIMLAAAAEPPSAVGDKVMARWGEEHAGRYDRATITKVRCSVFSRRSRSRELKSIAPFLLG